MKIYTRTGDAGQTGLVGGSRIPKASPRIAAIGDIDELNATIGMAIATGLPAELEVECVSAQNRLFDIGSNLAAPADFRTELPRIEREDVVRIERSIDALTDRLPPLTEFILPGGSPQSAALHMARCVCRRAERSVVSLSEEAPVPPEVLQYLNRFADWLFVAARTANADRHVMDVAWRKKEQS